MLFFRCFTYSCGTFPYVPGVKKANTQRNITRLAPSSRETGAGIQEFGAGVPKSGDFRRVAAGFAPHPAAPGG